MLAEAKAKYKIGLVVFAGIALIIYFALSNIHIQRVISKSSEGDSVVSVGLGFGYFFTLFFGKNETDFKEFEISTLQVRNNKGVVLNSFRVPFGSADCAKAIWQKDKVIIITGHHPNDRNLIAFERFSGKKLSDNDLGEISEEIPTNLDICS